MATPLPFPGISQTESLILALSSLQLFLSLQPMHIIDKKISARHYPWAHSVILWMLTLLLPGSWCFYYINNGAGAIHHADMRLLIMSAPCIFSAFHQKREERGGGRREEEEEQVWLRGAWGKQREMEGKKEEGDNISVLNT